ncbi:MAG: hypothetical protein V4534_04520 [Myxococcota bacterium]
MPEPIEEELPLEEEIEEPAEPATAPSSPKSPAASFASDQDDSKAAQKIATEEKFLEPMDLESAEAVPRRRGNFRTQVAAKQLKRLTIDPKEAAAEAGEKVQDLAASHGASILHNIPVLGLVATFFAKRKENNELKETSEDFTALNQARMKILTKQPHAALDIARGVAPKQFWQENQSRGVNLLLANTLEYAQVQLQKRFAKLQRSSVATDVQTIGAGVSASIIGAPIGVGISAAGAVAKAGMGLKSLATFGRKFINRTLGVERSEHASLLYGLALEHLQSKYQVPPARDLDMVNQSMDFVSTLGIAKDREQARANAFQMLRSLNVAPDPGDQQSVNLFMTKGFDKIMDLMKG